MPENKIICLNKRGWSQREIALYFGIKQSTLSKYCKRNDIVLRKNYVKGAECHNYKGYRTHDARGCPVIRIKGKPVREHRIIAAKILGRPPKQSELVHHINGDVKDNRPENIQIVSRSEHKRLHPEIGMETRFGSSRDSRRI